MIKKSGVWMLVGAMGLFQTGLQSAWADSVAVAAGTSVIARLDQEVSSATQKKGDSIALSVAQDVMIGGKKVFAAGAPVKGTVENASKRFIAGIGGQIDIKVDQAQAVDGSWVPVEYVQGAHNGSSLVSVVLTVVCCCVFIFIPGKDVSIPKGTLFETKVVNNVQVQTP